MTPFQDLVQQGAAHAWLFIPSAILLGALHGLEPGHSKTMMAAFIVAVRGTVWQAVLLGLAATLSHTAVVWAIGLGGMYLWRGYDAEASEPWFQLASAVAIILLALWMIWRTWREQQEIRGLALSHSHAGHGHDHGHGHHHGDEVRQIDTGHGVLSLEVYEDGGPPRWRLRTLTGHGWAPDNVAVETLRADGSREVFGFAERDGFLESTTEIPEPHEFTAKLVLSHGNHSHDYELRFAEHSHADHNYGHDELRGLDVGSDDYQDAHERAHARDIQRQFANRQVTTWQIVLFGLTGGLIPCPAAITVLLICLQLQQISLALVLVLCFSIGLALTMVTVGVVAAVGMRQLSRRWSGIDELFRKAPYASGGIIILVGLYIAYHAVQQLSA